MSMKVINVVIKNKETNVVLEILGNLEEASGLFYELGEIENFDPSCNVLNADVDGDLVKFYKNYHGLTEDNKELIVYSSYSIEYFLMVFKVVLDPNTKEITDKSFFYFSDL